MAFLQCSTYSTWRRENLGKNVSRVLARKQHTSYSNRDKLIESVAKQQEREP
jgi:hypothetical protein